MGVKKQYCTFYLGGLLFGVEAQVVQEVLHRRQLTRVPLAPAVVRGLMSLRGQIVTAVDLYERLELAARETDREMQNVVVRTDEGAMSLLVDEIGDIVEVIEEDFEAAPETLNAKIRSLVPGVYKIPGRLLHVLDVEKTLELHAVTDSVN
jgi:purine-binding chemotaxis protein CheW